jgi:hypothetical protein
MGNPVDVKDWLSDIREHLGKKDFVERIREI